MQDILNKIEELEKYKKDNYLTLSNTERINVENIILNYYQLLNNTK